MMESMPTPVEVVAHGLKRVRLPSEAGPDGCMLDAPRSPPEDESGARGAERLERWSNCDGGDGSGDEVGVSGSGASENAPRLEKSSRSVSHAPADPGLPARGHSHLLFGACVGSGEREAAAENAASLLGGAQQGSGGAGSDSQAVWDFLESQQLADLVTLRCEDPLGRELWAFAELNCALSSHFAELDAFNLSPVASFQQAPSRQVLALLSAALPPQAAAARVTALLLERPFSACAEAEVVRYTFSCPPCLHAWAARFGVAPTSATLFAVTGIDLHTGDACTLYVPHIAPLLRRVTSLPEAMNAVEIAASLHPTYGVPPPMACAPMCLLEAQARQAAVGCE